MNSDEDGMLVSFEPVIFKTLAGGLYVTEKSILWSNRQHTSDGQGQGKSSSIKIRTLKLPWSNVKKVNANAADRPTNLLKVTHRADDKKPYIFKFASRSDLENARVKVLLHWKSAQASASSVSKPGTYVGINKDPQSGGKDTGSNTDENTGEDAKPPSAAAKPPPRNKRQKKASTTKPANNRPTSYPALGSRKNDAASADVSRTFDSGEFEIRKIVEDRARAANQDAENANNHHSVTQQNQAATLAPSQTSLRRNNNIAAPPQRPGAYTAAPGTSLSRTETLAYDSHYSAAGNPAPLDPPDTVETIMPSLPPESSLVEAELVIESSSRELIQNAVLVPEGAMLTFGGSELKGSDDRRATCWQSRRAWLGIGMCVSLLLIAIGVGIAVGIMNTSGGNDSGASDSGVSESTSFPLSSQPSWPPSLRPFSQPTLRPTLQPTAAPTNIPRLEPTSESTGPSTVIIVPELMEINLPVSTLQALNDPTSPQAEAYQWLFQHPQLNAMSVERRQQLFALTTFFYATQPWNEESLGNWLDSSMNECGWVTSGCVNGQVLELYLYSSGLEGTIPAEVSLLTQLEVLYLEDNKLRSSLPTELGLLTKLRGLDVAANFLDGSIPTEFGRLTSLEYVWMYRNRLTGMFPSQLGLLPAVTSMLITDNALFESFIPSEFGQLVKLDRLELTGNQMGGKIPSELGRLTELTNLLLRDNDISGPIPSELGELTKLNWLWLHNNRLTSAIPPELGMLTALEHLYLYGNLLTGSIPNELSQLTQLEKLALYHNDGLFGSIPQELCSLSRFEDSGIEVSCSAVECHCGDLCRCA